MASQNRPTVPAVLAGMEQIARGIVLAIAVAIAVVTLGPISYRPVTGTPPDVERAFAFALLGGAIALAWPKPRKLILGTLLAVIFAALLEEGQNFVPGRDGRVHDFVIKALAVILGSTAVWVLRRMRRRPRY